MASGSSARRGSSSRDWQTGACDERPGADTAAEWFGGSWNTALAAAGLDVLLDKREGREAGLPPQSDIPLAEGKFRK